MWASGARRTWWSHEAAFPSPPISSCWRTSHGKPAQAAGSACSSRTPKADDVNKEEGRRPTERALGKGVKCAAQEGKTDKHFRLNQKLVSAGSLFEILDIIGNELQNRGRRMGKKYCGMSPVNVSTALHRIARQMEASHMGRSERLAVARGEEVKELVSEAIQVLPRCEARSISNIVWSLSKIGSSSLYASEFDLVSKFVIANLESLRPQHLANISSSFAAALHSSPSMLNHLSHRACAVIHHFGAQELSQLLWAFAVLSHPLPNLLDQMDRLTCELVHPGCQNPEDFAWSNLSQWSERQLSNLAWAYSVFNQVQRSSFSIFLDEINRRDFSAATLAHGEDRRTTDRHLSQLHQVQMTLDLEHPDLGLSLDDSLRQRAEASWSVEMKRPKARSGFEKRVGNLLEVVSEYPWVAEHFNGYYSLDFSVPELKLGLELDGPSHFARNTGFPLGSTIIKHRHLAMANWKVVSIPYLEWNELFGESEEMKYLEKKIEFLKGLS